MATTTATIFVGYAHPNHGGINPTHYIQLSENSRPALILHSIDDKEETKVMIPTLENMIDDVYLMIAVCVLKSLKPVKEIAHPGGGKACMTSSATMNAPPFTGKVWNV